MSLEGIGRARTIGSAVAIGNRWFITARHFSLSEGHPIYLENGDRYEITEVHTAPETGGNLPDLKLVKVDGELP
jgi:hypothetical protein